LSTDIYETVLIKIYEIYLPHKTTRQNPRDYSVECGSSRRTKAWGSLWRIPHMKVPCPDTPTDAFHGST
jgi:hypothetical protein